MIEAPIRSDALDYEDIISRIQGIFDSSTPLEQKQYIKILEELSDKGYSETLDNLYLVDFKEVPVSIDRFLCDPEYLGESNDCGNQIYPGWWDAYNTVFNDSKDIYEVILSGATRIGKTSTAVSMMCYMLYLLMCYRNPQKYFGLKEVSRATIAFANLTKDLALGVAFREFNDTLKRSPWFNRHGTFTNSITRPIYIPEGNQIELVAASDAAHVLGMQLWACLVGDTKISTDTGIYKIAELAGCSVNVKQYDYKNKKFIYTPADIKETKLTTELITIELEDGTVITGTPEHKIMLSNGEYKMLQDLTEADDILVVNTSSPDIMTAVKQVIGDDYINHGIWKYIPDGTNHHAICSQGDMVVRIPYLDTLGRRVSGKVFEFGELSGYYIVLHKFVHRLMIQTFKPNEWDSNLDVNHIDGNKHNNHIDNLEMVTRSENLNHYWTADCFKEAREASLAAARPGRVQRALGNTYGKNHKHIYRNNEHKFCHIDELPYYLSQGWQLGTNIITKGNTGLIWITDGIQNRQITPDDFETYDKSIWHKGMTRPKNIKVWVHKDDKRIKIIKEDLESYIAQGWELGSNTHNSGNSDNVSITDGIHNRMIPKSELCNISPPWRRGLTRRSRRLK